MRKKIRGIWAKFTWKQYYATAWEGRALICKKCNKHTHNVQSTCPYCGEYLFAVPEEPAKAVAAIDAYNAGDNPAPDDLPTVQETSLALEQETVIVDKPIAKPDTQNAGTPGTPVVEVVPQAPAEKPTGNRSDVLTIREPEAKKPEVRKSRRLMAVMPETKTGGRSASLGPSHMRKLGRANPDGNPSRSRPGGDGGEVVPQEQPPSGKRHARSQPPSRAARKSTYPLDDQPAMVKRHEYVAVAPVTHGTKSFNWMRLCIIAFFCIMLLTVGAYLFLSKHSLGQYWLASIGREASAQAYHELGRQNMINGSISGAIRALEIAQSKDTDNFEVLIDLGTAYKGNNQLKEAELCYTRAIQFSPKHPEPYRFIIQIMQEQGRNYEALQLAKLAMENTGVEYFDTLYKQMVPKTPTASPTESIYTEEVDVTLKCEQDAVIYYTINEDDPRENGILYEEKLIGDKPVGFHLEEGAWLVHAVAYKDGMYSEEMVQRFIINKPIPDMPKPNLQTGRYNSVKTVSLRSASDTVIYYTVDGTMPTTNSKVFSSDNPIKLRIGKTTIRAIAVNGDGKESNVMEATYECDGKTKSMMNEKDTVDKLELFSTTKEAFIQKYGEPQSMLPDGKDSAGTYEKLIYPFGYAIFITRKADAPAVLAELSTSSSAFEGPRGTKVGIRMENVIDAFRDDGGEENSRGGRDLYRRTDGRLGLLINLNAPALGESEDMFILGDEDIIIPSDVNNGADNQYKISYFVKLKEKHYLELSYHVSNGIVTRIEWLRYDSP